uniref:Uncharacterized protein n=1 Tax=Arundo donax TaxID=35708 RepID=A0A0A9HID9_ARUDO
MQELQALCLGEEQHVPEAWFGEEGRHEQRSEDPLLGQGETSVPLLCSVKLQRIQGCSFRMCGEGWPDRARVCLLSCGVPAGKS